METALPKIVYVLAMQVSLLGHSGDVLPPAKGFKQSYVSEADCEASAKRLASHFRRSPPPLAAEPMCIAVPLIPPKKVK